MEDRQLSITITAGTVVKALLIFVAAMLLFEVRDILLDVLTAIIIASAIEPAVAGMQKRKVPRALGVLLIYVILFAVFLAIFYFFLPLLFQDLGAFIASIPVYIAGFERTEAFQYYAQMFGVTSSASISVSDVLSSVQNFINSTFLGNAFSTVGNVFGSVFSFVIILVFSFYFAVLETGVDDFLRIIVPKQKQKYILGLWRRSQNKIGLWMQGQLLLAVIIGVLVFLGLTILGVPHALLLAAVAACFEIIPVFGPTLSAIPSVVVAFAAGGTTLAILTIALFVIAQQFENHLIYPLVVTRVVGVPPILVILALIIGGELAGFLGIILSVPIAATIQEFVRDFTSGRLEEGLRGE